MPYLWHRIKFRRQMSNRLTVIVEILQSILTLVSRLSRSLKVVGTDTDRSAANDFLLVIVTMGLSRTDRFRFKRRYLSKVANFSHPCVLNAPAEGVSLEFRNGDSAPKYASARRWK